MAREFIVAWAGRNQRDVWDQLCGDYRQRIERWSPVREIVVKPKGRQAEGKARLDAEAEALLGALPDPCWIVALDRRGLGLSSIELSERLQRLERDWPHPIAFVLGSDLGLGQGVLDAARLTLSLSKMTFPHELARLMVYEQLYRALSIPAGIKYHRQPL
jgi:23S rRNA (pseudouridine1915-N3)-methyltransferase